MARIQSKKAAEKAGYVRMTDYEARVLYDPAATILFAFETAYSFLRRARAGHAFRALRYGAICVRGNTYLPVYVALAFDQAQGLSVWPIGSTQHEETMRRAAHLAHKTGPAFVPAMESVLDLGGTAAYFQALSMDV